MAILDSGATGHFLTPNAPVQDKQQTSDPLRITMPDGRIISSTHTCTLDLPHLPNNVRAAHIVPGLAHTSLLSARVFCDAGYNVAYSRHDCTVSDKQNNIVLRGHRDPHTNLWRLPLTTKAPPTPTATTKQYERAPTTQCKPCTHNHPYSESSKVHAPSSILPAKANASPCNTPGVSRWFAFHGRHDSPSTPGTVTGNRQR